MCDCRYRNRRCLIEVFFLKPIFLIVNENAINNKINKYQYLMNDYTLWLIMYIINNASMERHADLTRNRVMTKSRKKRNIREKSLLIPLKKRLQKRLQSYISDQKKKIEYDAMMIFER